MADAEAVLVAWLTAAFPSARVVTETPANLADVVPCIQVTRIGGSDDTIPTFDNPTMDFDCYHSTRILARELAYAVRSSIRTDLDGQTVRGGFIERTRTISGPFEAPYPNTNLRRFTYAAQIRIHSLEA